jgi:hypothetical protein
MLDALQLAHYALALFYGSTIVVDQLHVVVASWLVGLKTVPLPFRPIRLPILPVRKPICAHKKRVKQQ